MPLARKRRQRRCRPAVSINRCGQASPQPRGRSATSPRGQRLRRRETAATTPCPASVCHGTRAGQNLSDLIAVGVQGGRAARFFHRVRAKTSARPSWRRLLAPSDRLTSSWVKPLVRLGVRRVACAPGNHGAVLVYSTRQQARRVIRWPGPRRNRCDLSLRMTSAGQARAGERPFWPRRAWKVPGQPSFEPCAGQAAAARRGTPHTAPPPPLVSPGRDFWRPSHLTRAPPLCSQGCAS